MPPPRKARRVAAGRSACRVGYAAPVNAGEPCSAQRASAKTRRVPASATAAARRSRSPVRAAGARIRTTPPSATAAALALASTPTPPPASAPRAYTPPHLVERILRTRGAIEGERKLVTVVFCDLADSTPVAERLGAELMHEVMDRCIRLILEQCIATRAP